MKKETTNHYDVFLQNKWEELNRRIIMKEEMKAFLYCTVIGIIVGLLFSVSYVINH